MEKTEVNLRELALDILIEVNERGAYLSRLLGEVLDKYGYLEKNRRSFLTRLVEGTVERRNELDYVIDTFSKVPVRKQKPFIRNLLRMSVYQLRHMDAVPDRAVCSEAVKLAKKRGFVRLSGFVNGVLRAIARGSDPLESLEATENPAGYLEIVYSVPRWLAKQWLQSYGFESTQRMLGSFLENRPLTIRVNPEKCTAEQLILRLEEEGLTVHMADESKDALELWGVDRVGGLGAFADGWFYVQDTGSMRVGEWAEEILSEAGSKTPLYVLDVCAAPGGKCTHIAQMLGERGVVEARDLTEQKVDRIRENIRRLGLENIEVVVWDGTVPDLDSTRKADLVVCDLPCSGLGVIGRKADIRWRMTPQLQGELVRLQRSILSVSREYVKPGGTLLYSTCTVSKMENEENVAWFLEKFPEFSLIREEQLLPGEGMHDGFFLARLVRREDEAPVGFRS